jgi:hypothetical protein
VLRLRALRDLTTGGAWSTSEAKPKELTGCATRATSTTSLAAFSALLSQESWVLAQVDRRAAAEAPSFFTAVAAFYPSCMLVYLLADLCWAVCPCS